MLILVVGALSIWVLWQPGRLEGATVAVNTFDDVVADDGDCSLREAIIAANTDAASGDQPGECAAGSGADVITLPAGTYLLDIDGAGEDAASTGDFDVVSGSTVTVSGASAATTVIEGCSVALQDVSPFAACTGTGSNDRIFHVLAGGNLTLNDITVTQGRENGGAVFNAGTLAISDSVLTQNVAPLVPGGNGGAAVRNSATGTITAISNTTFSGNDAGASGGAIYNEAGGTITAVTGSTFSGNAGATGAGAVANIGTFAITDSTLSGNSATGLGGGISNYGTLALLNVTISSNTAWGGLTGRGGGIANSGTGTVTVTNSIIANNSAAFLGPDCYDSLTSGGNNLIEVPCTGFTDGVNGDITGVDAQLEALASNGGATQTHSLPGTSPAIDAGDCTSGPATDQRGINRPQDATCDIGAYEALDLTVQIADLAQAEGSGGTTAFHAVVTLSQALPAGFPDVTVQFDTADGTAVAPDDYAAVVAGTVTFTAGGAATQNAPVNIVGDATVEPDETFTVTLSNEVGAVIADNQAMITITNDDAVAPPPVDDTDEPPVDIEADDLDLPVTRMESAPVDQDVTTEVETESEGGDRALVTLPPGAVPAGALLGLGVDLDALREQAALHGPLMLASFLARLTDPDGEPVPGSIAPPGVATLTITPATLGDADPATLVLVRWTPLGWVEVPVTVEVAADGTVTLTAPLVMQPAVLAVVSAPEWGAFTTRLFPGVTLTAWNGGGYDRLATAAGDRGAVWVTVDGKWRGYVLGAPGFVNAAFMARFPDGPPARTPVVVVR